MNTCPACEREFRSGSLVTLLDPVARTSERKRVCSRCASGGLIVVAPRQTPIVKGLSAKTLQSVDDTIQRTIRTLRTFANLAARESRSAKDPDTMRFQDGRAQGLEAAIELLRGPR